MIIGYARVSTEEQDLGRQLDALTTAGCTTIYQEKISGTKRSRPELDKMLASLQPGDVVIIQKLDRLGRSLQDLMDLIKLFKDREVGFKSLSDSFDTTSIQGLFIFQIMGAIAEFERGMISERIKHTLAFKRRNGIQLGRPKLDQKSLTKHIMRLKESGEKPMDIMRQMKISKAKMYRLIKHSKDEK
jgi:DNA invertase Pin-like site-specific DNA recombinase